MDHLNDRQRLGLFVAIALFLLVLVIHNPTQGYVTEVWTPCPADVPSYLCPTEPRRLSFAEWKSAGAMFGPLSSVGATALAVAALGVALAAWIILSATRRR